MNVYDFDKTIYHHDSTVDFYFYELVHHPSLIRFVPKQLFGALKYGLKMIDVTEMKKYLYVFMKGIKDIDKDLDDFWTKHISGIHKWYLKQQRPDDLVISGSPYFIVEGACRRLGISHLLASDVDRKSGMILAPNCSREQKVICMKAAGYRIEEMEEFYSDSHKDDPLARLAKKAWLVKGEELIEWGKDQ